MRGVYLLHFSKPLRHARHYLGSAEDIEARVAEHNRGQGARLTQVARANGIDLIVARTWEGEGREFERNIKGGRANHGRTHHGGLGRLCPICRALRRQEEAQQGEATQ